MSRGQQPATRPRAHLRVVETTVAGPVVEVRSTGEAPEAALAVVGRVLLGALARVQTDGENRASGEPEGTER